MKAKKIIMLLLSVTLLLQFSTFSSFAASGRVYIFTFTFSDLNTRAAASNNVLRHLWNMGYDAGEYLNNDAAAAYSVLTSSKIWVISSHGSPGILYLAANDNYYSRIYANYTATGSHRSFSSLSSNSLAGVRLVMFSTCNSGETSPTYGNLVTAANAKGAQCTVGWYDTLKNNSSNDWIRLFFEKADEEHDVIWECFNHADYWVEDIYGQEPADLLLDRNEAGNINQYLYQ